MKTPRENLLSLYRRQGYERAPVYFSLCPSLEEQFRDHYPDQGDCQEVFEFPMGVINDPASPWIAEIQDFVPKREWDDPFYCDPPIPQCAWMDIWGIAHEPGGKTADHMTRMRHPLAGLESLDAFESYPWPDFEKADWSFLKPDITAVHEKGLAVQIMMECTVWETAWYLRSMELLMMDMAWDNEKAQFLLDKITDLACIRVQRYASAGADIIALGDDVGMQNSLMMSKDMYRTHLKPRLRKIIHAAKTIKPDVIIQYHSCGYVTPLICDFIDAGVDVLNPIQPECMDFEKIHSDFGDAISFSGTLGTQTTMPFGTPEEVREVVVRNLEIAGDHGGLFCCPTHVLQSDVAWENIEAYIQTCKEFKTTGILS